MKKVRIGMIGSGFAARLHAKAYQRVCGVEAELYACSSLSPDLEAFAREFGFRHTLRDYREMLENPEIDLIDIITPVVLHAPMIRKAITAGKHVICEKPLCGFCSEDPEAGELGRTVAKTEMYRAVLEELEELRELVESSDRLFMYAENWVYMPAILKTEELLRARGSRILMINAEECHSGSHAPHAEQWRLSGGGSLIRQGCHPLSAVLYLKQCEGRARGEKITVTRVTGDMGRVIGALSADEARYIDARPVDVEDIGNLFLTFSDGSKAVVLSGDMVVGGMKNRLELYANDMIVNCNVTPSNAMNAYFSDDTGMEQVYITEKVGNKTGWQSVCADEDLARGYSAEIQDFVECVAFHRQPRAGFALAYQTARVIYAAYASDEMGRSIDM